MPISVKTTYLTLKKAPPRKSRNPLSKVNGTTSVLIGARWSLRNVEVFVNMSPRIGG